MAVNQILNQFTSDKEYPVGTVVVFGGTQEITISSQFSDTRVAGVVVHSSDGYAQVSTHGRTECKVVGNVKKGDLLVTSKIAGIGVVTQNPTPGAIIGKALEEFSSDHIGTIQIAVGCA